MTHYVLGFAFDDLGRVALIQKEKPAWQKGRWNGVGGKVEEDETPTQAMVREFHEETGVLLSSDKWRYTGIILHGPHSIDVYSTVHRDIRNVRTMTDERVELIQPYHLGGMKCIENIPVLVALCGLSEHPLFQLFYSNGPSVT